MRTILYCGHGWAENIGNAFIDIGINYSLRKVCPDDNIFNISNSSNYLKWRYSRRKPYSFFSPKDNPAYNFDLRTLIVPDFLVLGGSLLSINWMKINEGLIQQIITDKTPVIILGGGGGNVYSKEQRNAISKVLQKLNLHTLITRDEITYEAFSQFAKHSYNGIDNAFFLKDAFKPMKIEKDYKVSVFDYIKEPLNLFNKDEMVIRMHHTYSIFGQIEYFIRKPFEMIRTVSRRDIISDYPDDYLHILANAKETYSNRVHACVATLTFGGKARYYTTSDRSYLFERINLKAIREGLTVLDQDYIEQEKTKQINFLKSIL